MKYNLEEMYNILIEIVGVNAEALDLVFSINGLNEETACDILYYYTGLRSFESYLEEFKED